jgi:hypothetical protein
MKNCECSVEFFCGTDVIDNFVIFNGFDVQAVVEEFIFDSHL